MTEEDDILETIASDAIETVAISLRPMDVEEAAAMLVQWIETNVSRLELI